MHRAQSTRYCRDQAPGDAGTPGTTSKWGKVQKSETILPATSGRDLFSSLRLDPWGCFFFFFGLVWFGSGSGYTPQSDKYRRLSVRLGETFPRDAVSGCAQIGIDIRGDRRVSDLPERLDGVLFLFDHEPIRRFLATMPSHPVVHGVWRWCSMLVPRPFLPLSFRVFRRHGLCACFSTSAETKDLSLGVFCGRHAEPTFLSHFLSRPPLVPTSLFTRRRRQ